MPNPFLNAALRYHALGYHPIPCQPRDKRPLVAWKEFQTVSPTTEQIQVWWAHTPDANVALVVGRGRFAVDLDGGDAAEQLLADRGIALPPEAPRSRTGGGRHVFLSAYTPVPDRVAMLTTEGHKPQVDIRGVGIVVVPPSIHPSGTPYEWLTPLTDRPPHAPLALMDLIATSGGMAAPPPPGGSRFWAADALRGVGEGQRDQVCTKLAGYFLQKGLELETVITILTESFAKACVPPFAAREVEKCVRSIGRREAGEGEHSVGVQHIDDVLAEFTRALDRGPAPTLSTPFPTLNYFLNGGFAPGELIFLGARAGVGKTAFGLEVARRAAWTRTGAVLVVSREMTNLALARRLLAQDGRIKASTLKRAELTDVDRLSLSESLARLRNLPLWLTDQAVSFSEIRRLLDELTSEARLALVVVDYLQLISAPDVKERRHQVELISQGLKTLALQYEVPVLCLSSVSRGSADERKKAPSLSSLRESGELEHDADVILLLHRDFQSVDTQCHVAKNRDGHTGMVHLLFRPEYVSFDEKQGTPHGA